MMVPMTCSAWSTAPWAAVGLLLACQPAELPPRPEVETKASAKLVPEVPAVARVGLTITYCIP